MDRVSPEIRSRIMSRIRSTGNKSTELRLRGGLIKYRIRGWHLHYKELSGNPDVAFPKHKLAVFIDGCFWHGCPKCYRRPHSNKKYWDKKVEMNIKRDEEKRANIRKLGWNVLQFWEHELIPSTKKACVTIREELD